MLQLIQSNPMVKKAQPTRQTMFTVEQILRYIHADQAYLESVEGGFALLCVDGEWHSIPRELSEQIMNDPHIRELKWKEGWGTVKETGKSRWVSARWH